MEEFEDIQDARLKFELIKYRIRQFSSNCGKQRAKMRNNQEKELEVKLQSHEEKQDKVLNTTQEKEVETEIALVKTKLDEVAGHQPIKGLILRSQARWHEQGERSTKHFLQLASRNKERKQSRS